MSSMQSVNSERRAAGGQTKSSFRDTRGSFGVLEAGDTPTLPLGLVSVYGHRGEGEKTGSRYLGDKVE